MFYSIIYSHYTPDYLSITILLFSFIFKETYSANNHTVFRVITQLYSICNEFETIKERALKVPEESGEMMEMIAYVEKARIGGIQALNGRINESKQKMNYLLDVYFFSQEHIDLNCTVLMWPKNIQPVFDDNDEVSCLKLNLLMRTRAS